MRAPRGKRRLVDDDGSTRPYGGLLGSRRLASALCWPDAWATSGRSRVRRRRPGLAVVIHHRKEERDRQLEPATTLHKSTCGPMSCIMENKWYGRRMAV